MTTATHTSTRDRILVEASSLFHEMGYDATSLRAIADRLGFSKAALYYHFQSKEDILQAILEPAFQMQTEAIDRLDRAQSMQDWAEALMWMLDHMLANVRVFRLMERNRAAIDTLSSSSEIFEDHARLHDRVEAAVMRSSPSLSDRVRMICALGAVGGFDDFAGDLLTATDPEDLRREITAVVREVLGLPKSRKRPG